MKRPITVRRLQSICDLEPTEEVLTGDAGIEALARLVWMGARLEGYSGIPRIARKRGRRIHFRDWVREPRKQ